MGNDGTVLAWHFTNGRLRNGDALPEVGEWLKLSGTPRMCSYGCHASIKALDALGYAPGGDLHRVRVGGEIITGDEKIVGTERKILWTLKESDFEPVYRKFARWCALRVIDKWGSPDVVRRYLETGDESIRAAARAVAWDAAGVTAWDAAWAAARAVAWDAAWDAARAVAWNAAWAAARAVAGDAAWDAAWDAQNKKFTSLIMNARRAIK